MKGSVLCSLLFFSTLCFGQGPYHEIQYRFAEGADEATRQVATILTTPGGELSVGIAVVGPIDSTTKFDFSRLNTALYFTSRGYDYNAVVLGQATANYRGYSAGQQYASRRDTIS